MSGLEERIVSEGGFKDPTTDGIIPRSLQYLFDQTQAQEAAQPGLKYTIKASYLEIYNEQIFDLLNPDGKTLTSAHALTSHVVRRHASHRCVCRGNWDCSLRLSPEQKTFFVENL